MQEAPVSIDESGRLAALRECGVLDTPEEQSFDDLARLAAEICGTPIALVSLVDESRQWFKSHHGLDVRETPREMAFCAHAILDNEIFEVPDALNDIRFVDNPLVTGHPNLRFYAGTVLRCDGPQNVGTLCVIDRKPRELSGWQRECLAILGRQVEALLELRRHANEKERLYNAQARHHKWVNRRREDLAHFAYRSSHDLRAPAIQVEELARLTLQDIEQGDQVRAGRNLGMIKRASNRLLSFVDGVIDLGRADLIDDTPGLVDFEKLFGDVVADAGRLVPEHGVSIDWHVGIATPCVSEYSRLRHLLLQLLTNSIRYNNPQQSQPHATLRVSDSTGELLISVEDNGLGIPAAVHDQYFDMFRRFHPDVCSGSGVGTAIVRKHADALDGSVQLQSDSNGTTVSVRLPLHRPGELACPA